MAEWSRTASGPPRADAATGERGGTLGARGEAVAWIAAAGAITAGLYVVRDRVGGAQVTLAYLLLVLMASARRGRRLGFLLAGACFLAFNFFFVVPYGTFAVHDSQDWLVLVAFLATSVVAAQLLHRARAEATAARAREAELARLASLGAEALQAPRAEDGAVAVARVIREELGVRECELYLRHPAGDRLELMARADHAGARGAEGAVIRPLSDVLVTIDPRTRVVPLEVHDQQVGLLLLRADAPPTDAVTRHPFATALAYYAALGLERIRLTRAAERAVREREADRFKDATLSAVSHDLRTPLTSIKALAHAIAAEGDERAADIESAADRLNGYVTNLLDLSRLNAGKLPVNPELVPVDDLLGVLLAHVAGVAGAREVRVALSPDWTQLVGLFDYSLTLRVLTNLVENALHHGRAGAPVDIRASRGGDLIRIEVADLGPGIPPEDRERLFQPFQRGRSGNESPGAGLGLAIARQLTELQGGTIAAEPRPGGGTVFIVTLPAATVQSGSL